jgi:hypothetical protein
MKQSSDGFLYCIVVSGIVVTGLGASGLGATTLGASANLRIKDHALLVTPQRHL